MDTIAIILAGGKGLRFGANKQFVSFHDIPLFVYTVKKFKKYRKILTIPGDYLKQVNAIINKFNIQNISVISGGATRQKSVEKALIYIHRFLINKTNVIITDANRPFITNNSICECINKLKTHDIVVATSKAVNTMCDISNGQLVIYSRINMYNLLMPQCFNFDTLYLSHLASVKNDATDDAQLVQDTFPNKKITTIIIPQCEGLKLTYPEDYNIFNMLLRRIK